MLNFTNNTDTKAYVNHAYKPHGKQIAIQYAIAKQHYNMHEVLSNIMMYNMQQIELKMMK